ncbi:MAG: phytoene desaturase family protein, partial [Azonexus sp.]
EMAGASAFPASFHAKLKGMRPAVSAFQIYLGLDCTARELGIPEDEYSIFSVHDLDSQAQFKKMASGKVGDEGLSWFLNVFTNVDPSLAPPGKATLGITALVSGTGWHNLDKEAYKERKEALTKLLIERVEARIPDLSKHIEVSESGSPRTMTKYTGNYLGSINGFEQSVPQAGVLRRFSMHYPVKGLYQVGAWTFPGGGYMGAFLSSRILIDRFFRRKWRPFGFFLSRLYQQAGTK